MSRPLCPACVDEFARRRSTDPMLVDASVVWSSAEGMNGSWLAKNLSLGPVETVSVLPSLSLSLYC